MKKIGIIGGLSAESTRKYEDELNARVKERLGRAHNAKMIVTYVDFQEFMDLKDKDDWDTQGYLLMQEAIALEQAGADFFILATNTMHKVMGPIEKLIDIPFLHLADATAEKVVESGIKTVGLLGTKVTMAEDFYKGRLEEKYELNVLTPSEAEQDVVSDIIYKELCHGEVKGESREIYKSIIGEFQKAGAGGVILGCTEIGMLIRPEDVEIKVFDTAEIHIEAALEFAFKGLE